MRAAYTAAKWFTGAGCTLLVLVLVTDVFIPAERQYYLNARIAGLLENLDKRTTLVPLSDAAGPDLVADPAGASWLVTQSAGADATARFWQLLLDPKTYGQ